MFLKLFSSAGVRNVHICCGNDQAAKSAWGQGMTKVHLPDAAPCPTLCHRESRIPCFCSGALAPLPGCYKIWDCARKAVGESPWEPELPGNAIFATRDVKAYCFQTECLIRAPLGTVPQYRAIARGWVAFLSSEAGNPAAGYGNASSCPDTLSYREGGGAAFLLMETVFAAYPISLLFIPLLHF